MFNALDDDKNSVSTEIMALFPKMFFNRCKRVVSGGIDPIPIKVKSEVKLGFRFPDILLLTQSTSKQIYDIFAPTVGVMKNFICFGCDGTFEGIC